MIRRLCMSLCNCFGRVTPQRQLEALNKEARELAIKHKVVAQQHRAISERSALDARHHAEISDFYYSALGRLTSEGSNHE